MSDKEYDMNQVEFLLLERELTGAGMDVNSQLAKYGCQKPEGQLVLLTWRCQTSVQHGEWKYHGTAPQPS